MGNKKITVAYGDGIGPEIMESTLKILKSAGAEIETDVIEIGEKVYKDGFTSGIKPEAWDKIVNNKYFLKAPITTPQGGGYKSLNVTIRKTLGLFANVRPTKSLYPFVDTKHPEIDLVIVRENEEDLYAGIEHRQTDEVYQCLKLITRPGSEKIIRYAFEYAKSTGRKKVTCMMKDNIMKLTDGLFHQVFKEISAEYPEIKADHFIIDIGTARLAARPQDFDIIVTPNLYGDILSDVAAEIAGSVGLASSSNIGANCSMFEAIHGSAPDIAGKDMANPSGLLQAAILMLQEMGQTQVAEKIQNAWLATIESGIHTADIYKEGSSVKKAKTSEFTDAVISNFGKKPTQLKSVSFNHNSGGIEVPAAKQVKSKKVLEGVDVFIHESNRNPDALGERLISAVQDQNLELVMITNRGVKVYPNGNPHTFCTDHWRCRFVAKDNKDISNVDLINLLSAIDNKNLDTIKTENLYNFDGERGYSLGQGQ